MKEHYMDEASCDSLAGSSDTIYQPHYTGGHSQEQLYPGLVGRHFVSYPLWSKRSVRRKMVQESQDGCYEKEERKVSDIFREFGDATSIQGIPFAKKAKSLLMKVFWSLVILGGLALSVFQTYSLYGKYTAYDTNSIITISQAHLDFPSITFCNKNALRMSRLMQYGDPQLLKFLEDVKPKTQYTQHSENVSSRKKRQLNEPTRDQEIGTSPQPITDSVTSEASTDLTTASDQQTTSPGESEYTSQPADDTPPRTSDFHPSGSAPLTPDTDLNIHDNQHLINNDQTSSYLKLKAIFQELLARINGNRRGIMSHSLDEMLLACSYDGKVCGPSNFSASVHPEYGLCWTFNSRELLDQPLVSMQSGANYGLSLMLNVQAYDYLNGITDSRGVRADIHEFRTMSFPAEAGLSVATGTQTFVSLRKVNQTRLGGKYGECNDEGQFEDYYTDHDYTIKGCLNTCLERNISATCGCYRGTRPQYYNKHDLATLPRCNRNDTACTLPLTQASRRGDIDCNCRQACHSVHYDVELSNDVWPDVSLWWALVDATCDRNEKECKILKALSLSARERYLLQNFLQLKIYYRDLNVENIHEDVAYDVYQFMADFGGAVGLWLGVSAITMFELVDLVYHFISYFCKCKRKQKNEQGDSDEMTLPMDINRQLRLSNYLPKYHNNFSLGSQSNLDVQ